MANLSLKQNTLLKKLLKSHPMAMKRALNSLNLSCLECKGMGSSETVAQIATANGLDVDDFIRVIRSSIERE